ncbi:MAG: hypothetical protein NVS1B4_06810 [Gemmatimonadaceae bacterium]
MSHTEPDSITFTDDTGLQWEVREVGSPALKAMSPDRVAMPDYRNGWLLFTSAAGDRRRLAPVPSDWRQRSPGGLTTLVAGARAITPPSVSAQPGIRDVAGGG